jgi:PIN domain
MISWLSEVEMASALASKSAPGDAPLAAAAFFAGLAYDEFQQDRARKVYNLVATGQAVFERAKVLGLKYGPKHRVRALDILHVAAALRHGATAFGTFDRSQAMLAQDEGLKTLV